ncbi:hydroxymethylbilane synthase [Desulfobacterales bacterium HSG17]|nr:hydroxymethylbilane synthase [Desulfobacterales bacterium HSG17]
MEYQQVENQRVKNQLIIGTRGSKLALWQAEWVQNALMQAHNGLDVTLRVIKTKGDKILDVPLAKVGGKGLFVKEIEEALLAGEIDLAVHSMKDMPALIPDGLMIGAVPLRENPLDVMVSHSAESLQTLPKGGRVGTSSLRRASQILHLRPDIQIEPLRGNLQTRLQKLTDLKLDAIILAAAGMIRLGYGDQIKSFIPALEMLPAVGQGALCIETRNNDPQVDALIKHLDDSVTRMTVFCERAFLHRLEGGCQVPIAAHAVRQKGNRISISGLVARTDGSKVLKKVMDGDIDQGESLGIALAESLLASGGEEILAELI